MLIAIIPSGIDIQDVLGPVVDEIMTLNSVQFAVSGYKTPLLFHCTVSLVIGDSPASNALVGMKLNFVMSLFLRHK